MILTTKMAKDYELIIKSGNYDADVMLSDLKAARKRNLITQVEFEYLSDLVQKDIVNRAEEQVKQLG